RRRPRPRSVSIEMQSRNRIVAFAIAASVLAAGHGAAKVAASTRGSVGLPNPFTVTARWTARSLGLKPLGGLAVGRDRNLYVTDASQRVTVVSPAGKVLRRWGRRGGGQGEFRFRSPVPNDPKQVDARIAVGADGKVYVSDNGNARVQVFTASGRFVREFGG